MQVLGTLLVLHTLFVLPSQFAPPDISGRWEYVESTAAPSDAPQRPAFGMAPTITFEPMRLHIDFSFSAVAPGGMAVDRDAHLLFALDGARTNENRIVSTGSTLQLWDITNVKRGRIVIQTFSYTGRAPAYISRRREIFIDTGGQLVVETVNGPDDDRVAAPPSSRTVYRRRS